MRSQASLNLVTIRAPSLEGKLHAAATAGFRVVGLAWDEIRREGEAGVEEVRLSGLAISELVGISGWMDSDHTSRTVALAHAEQAVELAVSLDCPLLVVEPADGPVDAIGAARCFAEVCSLARPFGVRVGIEFIGSLAQINTVAAAWEIVDLAEAPNGGLVIDTFHFHRGPSTLDMVEAIPQERISLVQVSDCMELPQHEMQNRHRVFPGTGVLALEPLLAAVRGKGYSGYYSLELHNEEYWAEDPLTVAREGLRSLRRLDIP